MYNAGGSSRRRSQLRQGAQADAELQVAANDFEPLALPRGAARHRHRIAGAKIKLEHEKFAVRRSGRSPVSVDRSPVIGLGGVSPGWTGAVPVMQTSQTQQLRTHNGS